MRRLLGSLVACWVGVGASLYGTIQETAHFREILKHVDDQTLVLLDIDDTLLIPTQMLGCDEWFCYRIRERVRMGWSRRDALERSLAEWESIRHLTQMDLVEPGSDVIVHQLQQEGCRVMGITTQGLALATRTVRQLAEHGIDLTRSAPAREDIYLDLDGHGVLYRHGVLFTSGTSKGDALFGMLDRLGVDPARIVFINDKRENLRDVEAVAEQRGVSFVGLRYAYSDTRKAAFSPKIAEYQFAHSSFQHILSDEEARSAIREMEGASDPLVEILP